MYVLLLQRVVSYSYTVGLIITTRNFGQCVVNLYEVQKTQCVVVVVVIVGWSKILKIRVFLQIDPLKLNVRWNVTWVPLSALWLEVLGNAWPGVDVIPMTYNHQSNQPCTFSWNAVGKVFLDAMTTGRLRIPLACIEGTSELIFSEGDDMLVSITEELSYAQDLQRGCLLNRRCSDDLRLFLETGRRSSAFASTWDDVVAKALPWTSVPGSGPLDVTPTADDEEDGPVAFLGVAALLLVGFTNFAGPQLIGQSFVGNTHDILERSIVDSMF